MKRSFFHLAVGCATLLIASTTSVQASESTRVDAPQSFVVGKASLPAGTYLVSQVKVQDEMLWQITNEDHSIRVFFHTVPAVRDRNQQTADVRFTGVDGRQRLAAIFGAGTVHGREVVGIDQPIPRDFGSDLASGTRHKRSHDRGTAVATGGSREEKSKDRS